MNGVELERVARLEAQIEGLKGLLDEREKQVVAALNAADKANDKAERAQERVNETQNEFRQALKDQAIIAAEDNEKKTATLATRSETDRLLERIQVLEKAGAAYLAMSAGKEKGGQPLQNIMMLIVGAVIAYIAAKFGAKT